MCFAGRIEKADSLFKYIDETTFETFDRKDFEPLFLQEVLKAMTAEEKIKVDEKCKGNKECIFDYAITGKYGVVNITNCLLCNNMCLYACIQTFVCVYMILGFFQSITFLGQN